MPRKKKDEQTFADDVLSVLGAAILIIIGLVAYSFMLTNPTLASFLAPDNWVEFCIIGGVLLAAFLFIAYLNREVV